MRLKAFLCLAASRPCGLALVPAIQRPISSLGPDAPAPRTCKGSPAQPLFMHLIPHSPTSWSAREPVVLRWLDLFRYTDPCTGPFHGP
ncbi:hypothetical protein B0T20DRAFT_119332 [Sordaria brevicollis]|uniref:Secreted protein n=1 Tax=Sordaria brevicollis TaxID=83679 RepID=A0AAE0PKG2_SORBR|nr:hypothetical protein B0T20DRAFT_119332 [Sordaria brevicollis]